MIKLFEDKSDCFGCSGCNNICPKLAISMKPDSEGFLYPIIDNDRCIECRMCLKVCQIHNNIYEGKKPQATFAAIHQNSTVLKNSSSGGIFAALASIIINKGGIVFGCAFNEKIEPNHICVDNYSDIKKIQGSKYVQSKINNTYKDAKNLLQQGKIVLYTGTPCQIAGLRDYLGKEYDNLLTVDLICHGVPSESFFKDYILWLENKIKGKVISFKFRDKGKTNMGFSGKLVYLKNKKLEEKTIYWTLHYYYYYFMYGHIYRKSCYKCKYACNERQGDFTMGDYWGIESIHSDMNIENGVSLLLVNNKKGMEYVNELKNYVRLVESNFEYAKRYNGQLNYPISQSKKREQIFRTWQKSGYDAVAREFYYEYKKMIITNKVKTLIPVPIKRTVKKIKNKLSFNK